MATTATQTFIPKISQLRVATAPFLIQKTDKAK